MAIREVRAVLTILLANCLAPAAIAQPVATQPPITSPSTVRTKQPWSSPAYIDWLERRSMLKQSEEFAALVSGKGGQWQHQYAEPQPQAAVQQASVWLLDYPGSVITR